MSIEGRAKVNVTVAIMAGGKSSRMGTDKSFVPILGKPLIEHILERVGDLGQQETVLITNRPDDYAALGLPIQFKVVGFYDRVRVRTVDEAEYEPFDPRHLSFYNVNTPQELAEAQRLANEI
ncbi:MAG: NTP transferase domain-containing protein [Chloroflexi bacterium]|nr:NTP transferase domain-containing protein [Chloroflexota bacterium]